MKNNLLFLLLFLGIIGCSDDDISGSIYGTVSTEDGSVPINATMLLYKLERYYRDEDEREYGRWVVNQEKKTDDNGYYEFGDLSPVESYQLEASLKGYSISTVNIGLLKSERMSKDVFLVKKVDIPNFVELKDAGIAVQKLDISTGPINKKLAEELCAASVVNGYNDWRLPTLSELTSMYNTYLPNIKAAYYWSSTPASNQYYYQVNMNSGNIKSALEEQSYYARCVRSIQ